jgi:hypothetical protein
MVCAAALVAAAFAAIAENYPLTFKAVTADQMELLPGGYGIYGDLRLAKPAGIKKEPKPISRHAVYGETREDESGPRYAYRLDESKGDGKGYDQLIVDMNQNGDLTDDAVVLREAPVVSSRSRVLKPVWFGPIPGPKGKELAGGHPAFFAQVYLRPLAEQPEGVRDAFVGYLRFKAGWYLEATVDVDGAKRKIAIYDGNNNLKLGESPEAQNYQSGDEKNWYFRPADTFFVDANGSGAFEADPLESESRPFGPIVYFGQKPFKASLDPSCSSLRLEPWTDALAEVTLDPKGQQVRKLVLAWEHPAGKWQLLNPPIENGRIQVPPGRYRLYYCALFGQNRGADPVMVAGNQRVPKTPLKFEAGKANTLRCGGPLEVAATAQKRNPESWELPPGESLDHKTDSDYIVRINANFRGVDGEVYSTFAKGPKLAEEPAKPVFKVLGADGKQLAKGNLEFG